jgi:hypothetical protein
MRKLFYLAFTLIISAILFGKVLHWIFDFSREVNQLLNVALFAFIGLAYVLVGISWDHHLSRYMITICGASLIIMNFWTHGVLPDLLIPLFVALFAKEPYVENKNHDLL